MILARATKGPGDRPLEYWNDLLRGYELVHGLPTPLLHQEQVQGREQELRAKWAAAPAEDRRYVETSIAQQDQFIAQQQEDAQ
jgi:uncharacterized protein YmfQ (DUF2313 family)